MVLFCQAISIAVDGQFKLNVLNQWIKRAARFIVNSTVYTEDGNLKKRASLVVE